MNYNIFFVIEKGCGLRVDFIPFEMSKHKQDILSFRKDAYRVSFGSADDFIEEKYLKWLQEQLVKFPKGFALLVEDGEPIGQVELSIMEYEGRKIGYVHLFYLISEKRNIGLGSLLHDYAIEFFKENFVTEYHLRVAKTNQQAIAFYKKKGMKRVKTELDGKVFRMAGTI